MSCDKQVLIQQASQHEGGQHKTKSACLYL